MHAQPYQHVLNPGLLEAAENWEGENLFFFIIQNFICVLFKNLVQIKQSQKKSEQYWLKVRIHRKFSTSEKRGA